MDAEPLNTVSVSKLLALLQGSDAKADENIRMSIPEPSSPEGERLERPEKVRA